MQTVLQQAMTVGIKAFNSDRWFTSFTAETAPCWWTLTRWSLHHLQKTVGFNQVHKTPCAQHSPGLWRRPPSFVGQWYRSRRRWSPRSAAEEQGGFHWSSRCFWCGWLQWDGPAWNETCRTSLNCSACVLWTTESGHQDWQSLLSTTKIATHPCMAQYCVSCILKSEEERWACGSSREVVELVWAATAQRMVVPVPPNCRHSLFLTSTFVSSNITGSLCCDQ